MTPEELAAIRARIEAATGPMCGHKWFNHRLDHYLCTLPAGHPDPDAHVADPRGRTVDPADALALLAEVDRLQRRIDDTEAGLLADAIFAAEHE